MQEQISNILFFSKNLNVLVIDSQENFDRTSIDIFDNLFSNVKYIESTCLIEFNISTSFDLVIIKIDKDEHCVVLEKIKKSSQSIPILVLSAFENPKHMIKTVEIGVSGYLITPINHMQFQQQLTTTIEEIKLKQTQIDTVNKLTHALTLAKEYELAINESNILSRANLSGIITFVNDKFCEVSGYTKQELIGRNHNIIRHPDTPNAIFRNLWNHILQGKIWKGVVKNKNKNGKEYWVNTTIIPIKDKYDTVVEFMAIRHNLSELFSLQKEIEDTQREIIYKMGEVGETRSKETGNHVKRVAQYSKELALLYGKMKQKYYLQPHQCTILEK